MTINKQNLTKIANSLKSHKYCELLIVTKKQSVDDIMHLLQMDYQIFGENRVQEAQSKYTNILRKKFPKLKLHLIGPLQSNKTKLALNLFDVIQSIDRVKIVDEIIAELKKDRNIKTKDFFIQVNIGEEKQKSGIMPSDLNYLYNYCVQKKLNIVGLMCIPPIAADPEIYFSKMLVLKNEINKNLLLSMGMSSDYEVALRYQSNTIRIGSKIFQ